jgi:hypothetical protein
MKRLGRYSISALAAIAVLACGAAAAATSTPQPPTLTSVRDVQCPSPTLCVGIDEGAAADLVTSRAPRLGAAAWVAQTIGHGGRLRVLSCGSAHWCVAVDQLNQVLISTDPARGAASWKIAPGGPAKHLDNVWSLSCPTSRLCVGIAGHYVVSSTQPNHGGDAWHQALVNPNAPAQAIDCPSTSSCVAVSSNDRVMASTNPTAPTAWRSVRLQNGSGGTGSVSCASTTRCVVTDGNEVFNTTNLNANRPTWQPDRLRPSPYRSPWRLGLLVSCTAADVCAAAGQDGSVWASPAPSTGSPLRQWTRVAVSRPTPAPFLSIACVRGQLCVATDAEGHALSANAITQPGAWRRQTIGQPQSQTDTALRP